MSFKIDVSGSVTGIDSLLSAIEWGILNHHRIEAVAERQQRSSEDLLEELLADG